MLFQDADAPQVAEAGVVVSTLQNPQDQTSDWHRPEKLSALLQWQPRGQVHLWWCRVHAGQFEPPRRSTEGVEITPAAVPALVFHGRSGDSLRFRVDGAVTPVGYQDPTAPGFRYDLVADAAVVLPLVEPSAGPTPTFPGGLLAYPYFTFVAPGAALIPLSRFAVAMTVAGALRAHCQHEAALAWYDLVARPLEQDDTWGDCPPVNPVDDDTARRRAVLLAYLETLLDAADGLLCSGSPEHALRARAVLDVAGRVLGEPPRRVAPAPAEPGDGKGDRMTVTGFQPAAAALNPRMLALYERHVERVDLVRQCLDGQRLREQARRPGSGFWTAPDRPGMLTSLLGEPAAVGEQGCDICGPAETCMCSAGPYRFTFLVQKAMDLANELRGFGGALLSAFEKGDGELLAALRAGHERQLLDLGVRTRQLQWRDADWQVQALYKTKQGALARLGYYQDLLRRGHNAGEIGYESLTGVATASKVGANVSEGIAQGIGMTPDFWLGVAGIAGTPLQFQQFPLGNKLAAGFSAAARIMNGLADIASITGGLSLTEGGWERREDEWRQQVQVISIELEQIERQILGAERRRDAALRDLNLQQQQAEQAADVQAFLRDKFTNAQLYLHLQRETSGLHRRLYDLTVQAARRAQRAFTLERATSPRTFLPAESWEGVERGLLAGERLLVALRHMESAYLEENCREYELTKHVSLRIDFPLAFLQLQQTGRCEIDVPEWMFDLDYPGHYLRRIKNVTLTIPAVIGPYTGVHCRSRCSPARSGSTPGWPSPRRAAAGSATATPTAPAETSARAGAPAEADRAAAPAPPAPVPSVRSGGTALDGRTPPGTPWLRTTRAPCGRTSPARRSPPRPARTIQACSSCRSTTSGTCRSSTAARSGGGGSSWRRRTTASHSTPSPTSSCGSTTPPVRAARG